MFSKETPTLGGLLKSKYINNGVKRVTYPDGKDCLDVPVYADGNCMYYAIILAYLLPVLEQAEEFEQRMLKLLPPHLDRTHLVGSFKKMLADYNGDIMIVKELSLHKFVNNILRDELASFMETSQCVAHLSENLDELYANIRKPYYWGDVEVLLGLSKMLNVHIKTYVIDDDKTTPSRIGIDCGEEFPCQINLIFFAKEKHYRYLLDPHILKIEFKPVYLANDPKLLTALREVGSTYKYFSRRETEIAGKFKEFSIHTVDLEIIKKFVLDQYYDLPDFYSQQAFAIEDFISRYLNVDLSRNKQYLIHHITHERIQTMARRFLSEASCFFAPQDQRQVNELIQGKDPYTNFILKQPTVCDLWLMLLHVYATLHSPHAALAKGIERLLTRVFLFDFPSTSNSCKDIAAHILEHILPESELNYEMHKSV